MKHALPALFLLVVTARADDILYATDFEGSRLRLEALYRESGGFTFGADHRFHLKPGIIFGYGGDAPDRYYGSLWVIDELLRHFEENPPGQVFALGGNRDVNKKRLTSELSPGALLRPPKLRAIVPDEFYRAEADAPPGLVRRLKYIMQRTMGAPNAFDLLRQEIAARTGEKLKAGDEGFDQYVSSVYLDYLAPGGAFAKLLGRMKLAVRFKNTVFVHGGLTRQNLGLVPGRPPREVPLDEWFADLNAWYDAEHASWLAKHMQWSGEGPRAAEDLLEYPMPEPGAPSQPKSVITGRHVDPQNNPLVPEDAVMEYAVANGVRREIVGHTPIGDLAVTVRDPGNTFESIFADISYSAREDSVTWVVLRGPDYETAEVHGQVFIEREGWRDVRATTRLGEPTPVGQLAPDGSRAIAQTDDGRLLTTRMLNYRVTNSLIDCRSFLGH